MTGGANYADNRLRTGQAGGLGGSSIASVRRA
jgi:hypothetical protein